MCPHCTSLKVRRADRYGQDSYECRQCGWGPWSDAVKGYVETRVNPDEPFRLSDHVPDSREDR